ncbi:MAG: hypothetical protein QXE40_00120 [Nitrososphaerota archaeon]
MARLLAANLNSSSVKSVLFLVFPTCSALTFQSLAPLDSAKSL